MAWTSTGHGRASTFVYVTLDFPSKRTGDVKLQAPRASYGSRRSRVARRGKGKVCRSRVVQKRTRYTLSSVVLALIFLSHHNPSSPLCQTRAALGSTVSW